MKKILHIILVFFAVSEGNSQVNLVPNPSFENYTGCPDDWYQIDRVNNWEAYKGSPDYYNSCGSVDSFSTPKNLIGNQIPASGNSYMGFIFYSKENLEADEMIGTQLSESLIIGTKYFISFKVVFKYNNDFWICCANNKIGVRFTTQTYSFPPPPFVNNNPPPVNDIAHVWTDSIIDDTLNWNTIFGSIIADSSYNQIIIGNFFKNSTIDINDIIPTNGYSYYFIDDVCVSIDSSFAVNYVYTGIQEEQLNANFNIYPNPIIDYFQINQIFTAPYDLVIYNMLGQQLFQENNITTNHKIIDTSLFPKGILFITIKSNNQIINYKLLKQ
ncbi:MAG: T9SS type A sorting domain-containing protein [Flavobacteriia bacterium]|nr:T9SS type A sorting domain-containing protein [Flavobacteriia bacterium]